MVLSVRAIGSGHIECVVEINTVIGIVIVEAGRGRSSLGYIYFPCLDVFKLKSIVFVILNSKSKALSKCIILAAYESALSGLVDVRFNCSRRPSPKDDPAGYRKHKKC